MRLRPEHAVYAAAAAATAVLASAGDTRAQCATKTALGPVLAARVLGERRAGRLGGCDAALLLTGLAGATAGDVLLVDPDDDARLRRGAASFAVMQSAYAAFLLIRGARPTPVNGAVNAAAAAGGAALMRRRIPRVAPALTAYAVPLAVTGTLAQDPAAEPGARTGLAVGGAVFTVSDAAIAGRRMFLRGERARRGAEAFIVATYAAAHLMLIEGMLALHRR